MKEDNLDNWIKNEIYGNTWIASDLLAIAVFLCMLLFAVSLSYLTGGPSFSISEERGLEILLLGGGALVIYAHIMEFMIVPTHVSIFDSIFDSSIGLRFRSGKKVFIPIKDIAALETRVRKNIMASPSEFIAMRFYLTNRKTIEKAHLTVSLSKEIAAKLQELLKQDETFSNLQCRKRITTVAMTIGLPFMLALISFGILFTDSLIIGSFLIALSLLIAFKLSTLDKQIPYSVRFSKSGVELRYKSQAERIPFDSILSIAHSHINLTSKHRKLVLILENGARKSAYLEKEIDEEFMKQYERLKKSKPRTHVN